MQTIQPALAHEIVGHAGLPWVTLCVCAIEQGCSLEVVGKSDAQTCERAFMFAQVHCPSLAQQSFPVPRQTI